MSQRLALAAGLEERLAEIGKVDLVVGIPSFNNVRTIGHVVRAPPVSSSTSRAGRP